MVRQSSRVGLIDGFTPRQIELIDLLAAGKSNKEIADDLHIAYGTVKQHLVTLFRKLAVTSRNKAALVAQQLVREARRSAQKTTALAAASDYKWRMMSAVAVTLPEQRLAGDADTTEESSTQIIERKQWLQTIHRYLGEHVDVLEGQLMVTHNHGLLVWFGFPKAHTDDTDRALTIALAARNFARRHCAEYPALRQMGIGISNQTEMVADTDEGLYGMEVFRRAMALSEQSQRLGFPLMSRLSKRLSHMAIPTGLVNPGKSRSNALLVDAVVVLDHEHTASDQPVGWGGLPFMASVAKGVLTGIAQWVSVASWPISSTASLTTAMLQHPALEQFRCVHLRLPARKTRDILLARLIGQLSLLVNHPLSGLDSRATAGERLASQIRALCTSGPICLVVHGQNGLSTLRTALTDKGIELLVSQPLLVIAEAVPDNQPEAVVQTLGPRANGLPFVRSYVLRVPDADEFVSQRKIEAGALLDALSSLARSILVRAAHEPDYGFARILSAFTEPSYQVQEALQELQATGLIVPAPNDGFQFRDPVLAEAICQMDVQLPDGKAEKNE